MGSKRQGLLLASPLFHWTQGLDMSCLGWALPTPLMVSAQALGEGEAFSLMVTGHGQVMAPSAELRTDAQGLSVGLSHLLAVRQGEAAVPARVLPPAPQGPAAGSL